MRLRTTGGSAGKGRRLYLSAGVRVVVVEVESSILEAARRLFPAYEVGVPAQDHSSRADVILTVVRRHYSLSALDSPPEIFRDEMDAVVALEFALSRCLAGSLRDYVHLHASGTVVNGQAMVALGASGSGKSSLALAMLARGHATLGDDIVLLGANAHVSPFKRLLKVSPAVLAELGIEPADTVHWDPAWPEAWYQPGEVPGWAEEAPVAALVFAQYVRDRELDLKSISRSEALNRVLHSVMATGAQANESFDRLLQMVERAKAFQLTFNSSVKAAEVLCSLTK